MKREKRPPRDIGIACLMLLSIPIGLLITVAGLIYHFPTPGIYIGWLFSAPPGVITVPILIAVGLVNGACCYAVIWALIFSATRPGPKESKK
jgi:hypothetical protein